MPVNGKPNDGRFQLQLAPINYSLTDGTDIPPPLASPIEEKPPPAVAAKPDPINTTTLASTSTDTTGGAATNGNGVRTTIVGNDHNVPTSPTRPSSIRRFLSRKSLNTNYNNGTNHNGAASQEDLSRPETSGSLATANGGRTGGLTKQKSGGWFRKFTGNSGGYRNSVLVVMEEKQPQQEIKKGPPPPKLPELNQLKAKIPEDDEGSLGGGDMFKNIQ